MEYPLNYDLKIIRYEVSIDNEIIGTIENENEDYFTIITPGADLKKLKIT